MNSKYLYAHTQTHLHTYVHVYTYVVRYSRLFANYVQTYICTISARVYSVLATYLIALERQQNMGIEKMENMKNLHSMTGWRRNQLHIRIRVNGGLA